MSTTMVTNASTAQASALMHQYSNPVLNGNPDRVLRIQNIPVSELRKTSEELNTVPSLLFQSLKSDLYMLTAGIGLIALGKRGLNRLQSLAAKPSFSLLTNPTARFEVLPTVAINAGLGIFSYLAISKMWNSLKLHSYLSTQKYDLDIRIKDQEAFMKNEHQASLASKYSSVADKS